MADGRGNSPGSRMAIVVRKWRRDLGFVFGQIYRFLPSQSAWQKGVFFAVSVWIVMALVFYPIVGRGVFAVGLGLGLAPAVLMLVMLLVYSVTMSLVYDRLSRSFG